MLDDYCNDGTIDFLERNQFVAVSKTGCSAVGHGLAKELRNDG